MGIIQKIIEAEGGDNFKYLMEKENKNFGEVAWDLALKHGLVKPSQKREFFNGFKKACEQAIVIKTRQN